jgi:aspartokinase-like uncharacterized kinase
MELLLKTIALPLASKLTDTDEFEHYIAISSDCLVIVDKQTNLIETIILGNDYNGYYFSAPNEDAFLDAISDIKAIILSGNNPLNYIEGFNV